MEWAYDPQTIDCLVLLSLLVLGGAGVWLARRHLRGNSPEPAGHQSSLGREATTIVLVFLGIWVAYASMRNQLRLAAETETNDEGNNIFQIEMADANLRCLYGNFAFDDPAACLSKNTRDGEVWSKAEFYAEEALFVLHKSMQDQADWASRYSRDVEYWAQDVEGDPTGIFTYYAVSHYGLKEAQVYLRDSGVCIPDICDRYDKVYAALSKADPHFTQPRRCPTAGTARRMVGCAPRAQRTP